MAVRLQVNWLDISRWASPPDDFIISAAILLDLCSCFISTYVRIAGYMHAHKNAMTMNTLTLG